MNVTIHITTRLSALLIVVLWSCYDAFWNLGNSNINSDEDIYVQAGWQYVHGNFSANREHPPVAKYLFGLAELIGGRGVLAPRILVAFLVLAGGTILFFWLRREIGFWGGLLAATLWELVPRGVPDGSLVRIDHFALLEPVMGFFALAALATSCIYLRRQQKWWWAVLSGALMAASLLSKVSVATLIIAFAALPLILLKKRKITGTLKYYALWLVAFIVAFVALYYPVGIVSDIKYMISFQGVQERTGHPSYIAGHTYLFSPWWANFWFLASGMGVLTTIVVCAGIVCAFTIHPDRLVIGVTVSFIALIIFYCFIARIASSYYYYPFLIFVVILAAIGYARLAQTRIFTPLPRIGTWVMTALTLVGVVQFSVTLWHEHIDGVALAPEVLAAHNISCAQGPVLVSRLGVSYSPYITCPTGNFTEGQQYSAILLGNDPRTPTPTIIQNFINNNRGHYTVTTSAGVSMYIPNGVIQDHNNQLVVVVR